VVQQNSRMRNKTSSQINQSTESQAQAERLAWRAAFSGSESVIRALGKHPTGHLILCAKPDRPTPEEAEEAALGMSASGEGPVPQAPGAGPRFHGCPALWIATVKGNLGCVKALLEGGADPNAPYVLVSECRGAVLYAYWLVGFGKTITAPGTVFWQQFEPFIKSACLMRRFCCMFPPSFHRPPPPHTHTPAFLQHHLPTYYLTFSTSQSKDGPSRALPEWDLAEWHGAAAGQKEQPDHEAAGWRDRRG
jgi:hypothetical protein